MEARAMNTVQEAVVATLPKPEEVIDAKEAQISGEIAKIGKDCTTITVTNDEEYAQAAEMGKEIKRKAKMVKELFAPIKEAANKAHKATCDREKQMLAPLTDAEQAIKKEMSRYTMQKEAERRRLEEEARRRKEEEAARLLERAVAAEAKGDERAVDQALADAQIMSETPVAVSSAPAKVKGVINKKDFEITVIDESRVPVSIAGKVIRPVDTAAIMKLVRATDGGIAIPGVVVKEVTRTVLRS